MDRSWEVIEGMFEGMFEMWEEDGWMD